MIRRSILLIDDDMDDRLLFCEALESVAPEIVCTAYANGRVCLAKLNNKEIETPDVVFLDINMPFISGWQCLSILKEHDTFKHIPVIMYSTSSNTEDIAKAHELGALCFFTKLSEFKELKKSLGIVAKHLHNNSLHSLMDSSSLFAIPKASH